MNHSIDGPLVLNTSHTATRPSQGILVFILLSMSIWILVVNALIFCCLLASRKTLKTFVNIQMLSFSLTDMFVGLCAIPVTLTYQITTAFPYFETCAAIFYGYSISQAATMYHAFVICIHRIVIIKRYAGRRERNPKSMLRTLFLQIALIWMFSMLIVSVPFGIYGRFGQPLKGCSLNTLFEENYIQFCAFMDAILLIPQIGMNVIYVYMFRFLFTTWRKSHARRRQCRSVLKMASVKVTLTEESTTDNGTRSASHLSQRGLTPSDIDESSTYNGSSFANQPSVAQRRHVVSESLSAEVCELKCCERSGALKVNFKMEKVTSDIDKETVGYSEKENVSCEVDSLNYNDTSFDLVKENAFQNEISKQHDETFPNTIPLKSDKTKKHFSKLKRKASKRKNEIKLSYEGQKEVLITIGLILLVVNVTMTPLNLLFVIELLSNGFLSRELKLIMVSFAMMNSAFNPGIYALRIKLFRKAVSRNLKTCFVRMYNFLLRIYNFIRRNKN